MSETSDLDEAHAKAPSAPSRTRSKIVRRLLVGVAVLLALLIGVGAGVRFGVRSDAGRRMVTQALDGLPLGAVGRLHVSGMRGDLFDTFGFREIAIIDDKGPWLQAQDATVVWDPVELLGRRLHLFHLHGGLVQVLRQPRLIKQPLRPPSKPPVSLILDDMTLRLETAPAFSVQHGLWDLAGKAQLHRNGRVSAALTAHSLIHPGDGLTLALQIGHHDRFVLRADAVEAGGGALAGALGLPANQSLTIHAFGDGRSAAGQAHLQATSGPTQPLAAAVFWDKTGATVHAEVSLTASRLTKFFADRLGPDARIDVAARPIKGDLYKLTGAATARDGSIRVNGPLDWAKRKTTGLDLTIVVAALSKWVGLPKIGPAKIAGVLSGSPDVFTLKGVFQGERLDQFGYGLARVSGPAIVGLKNGDWRLQADLAGAGGGGKGLSAVLLGSAPKATLDLTRLKDGHLLFRTLDVIGAGLKISAQGGQGLFGDLSFKGAALLTNLAPLHAGAKGQLTGAWTAAEARGGKTWTFSFDGNGASFASGLLDVDHFLGPAPRLTAKGTYGEGGLSIADASLIGAAVQAHGKGGLDAKQQLTADFDWDAKGPIVAGPLEIAGAAKGTGRITGTIAAPRADLAAELSSLDFGQLVVTPAHLTLSFVQGPDGVTGAIAIAGPTARFGPATAKAAFHFAGDGVNLSDIAADAGGVKLSGALTLKSGEPSSADLAFIAGPGAFLASGKLNGKVKLADHADGAVATIAVDGVDVSAIGAPTTFHALSLHAQGPLKQLPVQVSLASLSPLAWTFAGNGVFDHAPASNQLSLQGGGRIRKADFKLLEPAVIRIGGPDQGLHLKAAVAGGQAVIVAREVADGVNAKADLTNVGLGAFSDDFTGAVSGSVTLQGQGARLNGVLDANLAGARSRDAPVNEALTANVKGTLSDRRLHLEAVASNVEGLKSSGFIDLPAEASAAPFRIAVDRTRPVQGAFSADGEVRPLWDLFAGGERILSGHVTTSGTVQGTLNDFKASGQGGMTSGKFRDVSTGLALQNLEVDTTFGDDAVTVRRFSGADARGGSVSGDGVVSFAENGASTFTLNLKRFQLIDNDFGRATASGAVTVTHPAKGARQTHRRLDGRSR